MRIPSHRRFAWLAVAALTTWLASVAAAVTTVMLPVEVVGEDGTTASVTVDVPPGRASDVRSLWMQIHGLSYAGMASVQVNNSAWLAITNDTVTIAEPGRSYGGIGGGFATLKVTLALPAGAVVGGTNTIRFRFNRTDGIASGFRVVDFNLLAGDARKVIEPGAFTQDDPGTWTPPLTDADSLKTGRDLWLRASLKESTLPNARPIRAYCADCHAHDGRDLKYFNFSNASIAARSRFHGLSDLQGRQIASYIRSLDVPNPGRPWNPPYQPGPGLDARPVTDWAAGAGLSWALENDAASLPFMFATGRLPAGISPDGVADAPDWSAIAPLITPAAFRPDGNLNAREIPIALQLPDWSHWLPRVHPLDAWGSEFEGSDFSKAYDGSKQSLRSVLASPALSTHISSGRIVSSFEKWTTTRRALLKPHVEGTGVKWSPELATKAYATQLWQLVKTWEMTQEFGLEGRGRELFGAGGDSRTWFNSIPAATAPTVVNIPDGPSGMGGSALTNEYFDAAWYQLQVLLNSGNHRHRDRLPLDWIYVIGPFKHLHRETRRPEPARLLVSVIKSMQSTDPRIGPEDIEEGWRPARSIDPTIMMHPAWAPMFQHVPAEVTRAMTESLLEAWLDKNQQYRVDRYFRVGLSEKSYAAPGYAEISSGKPWESAARLKAAGVRPDLIARLQAWGTSYSEMAARYQYAGKSGRGGGEPKP